MAKTRKTYEMAGFNACKTSTTYMGVKVNLNFDGGNTLQKKGARLTTDNPFAQDAIEADRRFQFGQIKCVGVYTDEEPEEKPAADAAGTGAEVQTVEDVTNINELDAWFAERGVTLTSSKKAYIKELCEEHKVAFPNLKLK